MPIQKAKKKKKGKPKSEKTPSPTTRITNIVRVNVGDVKPKPKRRRPAKKKDAAFSFGGGGGGGGGSGLAQVVQAPQVTQDVLQESKELRRIVSEIKTSPQQQTLLGMEQGGQNENQLISSTREGFMNVARIMSEDKDEVRSRMTNLEDVMKGGAQRIQEQAQEASNKADRTTVDTQRKLDELHDLTAQVTHGFLQTADLTKDIGRRQMRQSPLDKAAAEETDDEDDAATVQGDDPAPTLTPGKRGKALTDAQRVQILNKIREGNSADDTATILGFSVNTVKKVVKDMGGAKDVRKTPNPFA